MECTQELVERMTAVDESWNPAEACISSVFNDDIILKMSASYERYTAAHSNAVETLSEVCKRKDFRKRLDALELDSNCRRQKLKDFMMLPIQHMMRYSMHLKDMHKVMHDGHPDKANLEATLATLNEGMGTVNKKHGEHEISQQKAAKQAKEFEILKEFLKDMEGGDQLLKGGRVKISEVKCKSVESKERKMILFLMNDSVVVAERRGNSVKKVSGTISKAFKHKGGRGKSFKALKKECAFPLESVKIERQSENNFRLVLTKRAQEEETLVKTNLSDRVAKDYAEQKRVLNFNYTTTHIEELIALCHCMDDELEKNGLPLTGEGNRVFDDGEAAADAAGAVGEEPLLGSTSKPKAMLGSTIKPKSGILGSIRRVASNMGMTPSSKHKNHVRGGSDKEKQTANTRSSVKRSASSVSTSSRKRFARGSTKSNGGEEAVVPPQTIEFN
jgi:hypothetical protein